MDSVLGSVLLPVALAVVMLGLGLSLTVEDFVRVRRQPAAVFVALVCQLVLLPALCFGLVVLFGLPPLLAVGMMLLAASPGGTTANLFSHVFRGDVALNITLTAVNSVLAVVTLPLVTNIAIKAFAPDEGALDLQFDKVLQVFAIVLAPVVIGMVVRRRWAGFADRMDRPVRIFSVAVLASVIVATVVSERANLGTYLAATGVVVLVFCSISLSLGYFAPLLFGIGHRQAIASAFEIGVHNSTLAITIAISVLGSTDIAVPAAVYGVVMFPVAAVFGWFVVRVRSGENPEVGQPIG
ncbi:bile acid:sodium symporter family protein [Umezawaea sp. Da 62-37]|uniref:bile acid:sodium symporter family protein n=1 Tax=Umezawaea sp. Da 62-37 TaxID=3075927 RepID=UPI0028F730BF|nr:bile acid:sodium symporter family protein [Umezawaea sp. Da 62-37]WNV88854.1 bile acid:sodium symporter family protein [Umezawaea sp. Da 62-37]